MCCLVCRLVVLDVCVARDPDNLYSFPLIRQFAEAASSSLASHAASSSGGSGPIVDSRPRRRRQRAWRAPSDAGVARDSLQTDSRSGVAQLLQEAPDVRGELQGLDCRSSPEQMEARSRVGSTSYSLGARWLGPRALLSGTPCTAVCDTICAAGGGEPSGV